MSGVVRAVTAVLEEVVDRIKSEEKWSAAQSRDFGRGMAHTRKVVEDYIAEVKGAK